MGKSALALGLAVVLVMGCTPGDDPLGTSDHAIVNGALDTVHQSAVAYLQGGKCSASIIEVNVATGEGYALTAAHCISGNPGVLRQGNTHNNPDAEYPVVERDQHPGYADSSLYDFAMLRFTGATTATPVTPPLDKSTDNIFTGTPIDLVGYGQTENGGTSYRHHVIKPVLQAGDLRLYFDQAQSGVCSGDSGGPGYRTVQSGEYVGAVNVAATEGCVGPMHYGIALRVSAVEATFIRPFIDGTPYLPQTCDECSEAHTGDGDCTQTVVDCFDDADCEAYDNCIDACSTQVCVNQCKQMHPSGLQLYQQIIDCLCTTACPNECNGDGLCQPPPECFIDWPDDTCESCANQACCAQQSACAVDNMCAKCFGTDSPPGYCVTYPLAVDVSGCLEQSCADACAVMEPTGAGGGTGGGGGASVAVAGTGGTTLVEDDFEVVESGCACATPGRARPSTSAWLWLLALACVRHQSRRRVGGSR